MSPKACANCGADCKKTKGKYQELCQICLAEKVESITRHVEQCGDDECVVCEDRLGELQDYIQRLYVATLLERDLRTRDMDLGEFI